VSNVTAVPEMMAAAATDVAAIGSTVNAAHMAAAVPTVAVIPAAADEVSASIAQVFSGVAQDFHALVGQAATFGQQFAQHLSASAGSYVATEAANLASLIDSTAATATSGITAVSGPLLNTLTGVANTLAGVFTTILTELETLATFVYNLAYYALAALYLSVAFTVLLWQFGIYLLFHVYIPVDFPLF